MMTDYYTSDHPGLLLATVRLKKIEYFFFTNVYFHYLQDGSTTTLHTFNIQISFLVSEAQNHL